MSKKAVFILAPEKFRDEEYSEPKLILESAGIETFTASSRMGIAHGKLGLKAKIDLFLPDLKPQQFDAVIFVGGPGCYDYSEDPVAWRIARESATPGKVLASICSAGGILANAGVLTGRNATSFPADGNMINKNGGTYTASPVEIDKNGSYTVITANGPENATAFGEAIAKELQG